MDTNINQKLVKNTIDLYLKGNSIIVNRNNDLESGTWSSYFQGWFEWAGLRDRDDNLKKVTFKLLDLQKQEGLSGETAKKVQDALNKLDFFVFLILKNDQLYDYLAKGDNINKLTRQVTNDFERFQFFQNVLLKVPDDNKDNLIKNFVENNLDIQWNVYYEEIKDIKLIEAIYLKLTIKVREKNKFFSVKLFELEENLQLKMKIFANLAPADQKKQIDFIKNNYQNKELLGNTIALLNDNNDPAFLRDILINFKQEKRFKDALTLIEGVSTNYNKKWLEAQKRIITHYLSSENDNKAFENGRDYLDSYDLQYLESKREVYQDLLRSLADAQKEWQSAVLLDKAAIQAGSVTGNVAKYCADRFLNVATLGLSVYACLNSQTNGWLGLLTTLYASLSSYAAAELGFQAASVAWNLNSVFNTSGAMTEVCSQHFSSYEALCNQWYEDGENAQYAANLVANIGLTYRMLVLGGLSVPIFAHSIHRYASIPLDQKRYQKEFNERIGAAEVA